MITNLLDSAILQTVSDLKGVPINRLKPVYDQLRVQRPSNSPAYKINMSGICLLIGCFSLAGADMAVQAQAIYSPKFLVGDVLGSFDLLYNQSMAGYSVPAVDLPVLFDNIEFPVTTASYVGTSFISFIRFDVI